MVTASKWEKSTWYKPSKNTNALHPNRIRIRISNAWRTHIAVGGVCVWVKVIPYYCIFKRIKRIRNETGKKIFQKKKKGKWRKTVEKEGQMRNRNNIKVIQQTTFTQSSATHSENDMLCFAFLPFAPLTAYTTPSFCLPGLCLPADYLLLLLLLLLFNRTRTVFNIISNI